jgi:hypothetical protein
MEQVSPLGRQVVFSLTTLVATLPCGTLSANGKPFGFAVAWVRKPSCSAVSPPSLASTTRLTQRNTASPIPYSPQVKGIRKTRGKKACVSQCLQL